MAEPKKGDLESSGLAAHAQQYGATEPGPDKLSAQDLPLFLGLYKVAPKTLYNIALGAYVAWFVVYRLADIVYIITVDARFPAGLSHLYPSEEERLASVSYTRQVLLCGFLHRCCVFTAVVTFVVLGLFGRFEAVLRSTLALIPPWWEESRIRACCSACWSPFSKCGAACCVPFEKCAQFSCCLWCSNLRRRTSEGRLATEISNRFGFPLTWRELLFGALYMCLLAGGFYLISAPFMYWSGMTNLSYGFSNPLSTSGAKMRAKIVEGFFGAAFWGIPMKFLYLCILQYRRGWLFMYLSLMVLLIWAQYNIKVIAPWALGMKNPFPDDIFAVGRGFPWVPTDQKDDPWISLNRIYFKDPSYGPESTFSTRDKSKGQLTLTQHAAGTWTIQHPYSYPTKVYSETVSAVANHVLEGLRAGTWSVGAGDARVGVRSGSHLRDKLYGFARDRHIGIAQIYMVDGSHKDIRANAFVAGAGNQSVVGLFDTLFLGQRNTESDGSSTLLKLTDGDESVVQHDGEIIQNVDTEMEKRDSEPPRNSAPTQAMGDDEIVSILAHELGHAALKHLEQGMVVQAITQLVTFATLGWMAHSPLAAAAFGLHAPILHVGAILYEHVVGLPVEGLMKFFTDALTRHNEYEADAYAALISKDYANALQTSLAKLSVNSNQDPDMPYFYEILHTDHPAFSRRWAHIEATKKEAYAGGPPPPTPPL